MEHSQIILATLDSKNISAYKLAKGTGISESLFSKWKKNPTSEISSCNLAKIADYLDCSVDYLLGRTEAQKITVEHDKKAQQLLDIFYSFNDEGRNKLLEQAIMMQSFGAYNADSKIVEIAARSGRTEDVIMTDTSDNPNAPDSV